MEVPIDNFENNTTEYKAYAGFWIRFLAYVMDAFILNIAYSLVVSPILKLMGIYITTEPHQQEELRAMRENTSVSITEIIPQMFGIDLNQFLIFIGLNWLVSWLYYALMESSPKRGTLGKMALGIQVTDLNGHQISFLRATVRYFSKFLSGAIFLVGYIMAGLSEKRQALHDIISRCLVYRK